MWPFYHQLVGATFKSHPPGLYDASVDLADALHPVRAGLPAPWTRTDEWYSFTDNPAEAGTLDILLTLDESTLAEDPSLSMTPGARRRKKSTPEIKTEAPRHLPV